jgi:hypothetical protein
MAAFAVNSLIFHATRFTIVTRSRNALTAFAVKVRHPCRLAPIPD